MSLIYHCYHDSIVTSTTPFIRDFLYLYFPSLVTLVINHSRHQSFTSSATAIIKHTSSATVLISQSRHREFLSSATPFTGHPNPGHLRGVISAWLYEVERHSRVPEAGPSIAASHSHSFHQSVLSSAPSFISPHLHQSPPSSVIPSISHSSHQRVRSSFTPFHNHSFHRPFLHQSPLSSIDPNVNHSLHQSIPSSVTLFVSDPFIS